VTIQADGGLVDAKQLVAVTVSFAVSKKGPYGAEVAPSTLVGTVRQEAMTHFEVADGSQFTYVLSYGGQRQPDDKTIGQVAGDKHSVDFRLIKEITQG
jgi:hypothetical protein